MPILELKEILQDQHTYFESLQKNILTIIYRFEHASHDIFLNFLFQTFIFLF